MLKYAVIALCIALASAKQISLVREVNASQLSQARGIVTPVDRCGGGGTPVQLRISGCTGAPPCTFISGTEYLVEGDFIPHVGSNGVSLRLTLIIGGIQVPVLDAPTEPQQVNPGQLYTIAYGLTPDNILVGQRITLQLEVYHTESQVLEICISAPGIIE